MEERSLGASLNDGGYDAAKTSSESSSCSADFSETEISDLSSPPSDISSSPRSDAISSTALGVHFPVESPDGRTILRAVSPVEPGSGPRPTLRDSARSSTRFKRASMQTRNLDDLQEHRINSGVGVKRSRHGRGAGGGREVLQPSVAPIRLIASESGKHADYPLSDVLRSPGDTLASYTIDMQWTLQCGKKWYQVLLMTGNMYPKPEEEESLILEAAGRANQEASMSIPPKPLINFDAFPGQRALMRATAYWLRGRFKTKAKAIVKEAYSELFQLYDAAVALGKEAAREKRKLRKAALQEEEVILRRKFATGIARLLKQARFVYRDFDCLKESSSCSGLFLHEAHLRLMASMIPHSSGYSDGLEYSDFFTSPPLPLTSISIASIHHVLSCYTTGIFIDRRAGPAVKKIYDEMMFWLTQLKLSRHSFDDLTAEWTHFSSGETLLKFTLLPDTD